MSKKVRSTTRRCIPVYFGDKNAGLLAEVDKIADQCSRARNSVLLEIISKCVEQLRKQSDLREPLTVRFCL